MTTPPVQPARKPVSRSPCRAVMFVLALFALVYFPTSCMVGSRPLGERAVAHSIDPAETLVQETYDYRFETHRRLSQSLLSNLQLQGLAIILALVVLRGGSLQRVDVKNIPIPTQLVPVLVVAMPLALMYLWIEFGYLLKAAIENRMVLLTMIREIESLQLNSLFSAEHLLSDNMLVLDPWVQVFEKQQGEFIPTQFGIALIKVIGFVLFLSLEHACIFALICFLFRRGSLIGRLGLLWLYIALMLFVLMLTHVEFAYVVRPNWAQVGMLGMAAIWTGLLCRMTVQAERRRAHDAFRRYWASKRAFRRGFSGQTGRYDSR